MLKFYKTSEKGLSVVKTIENGCWVNAVNPSETEIAWLSAELNVTPGFLRAALDQEETSRIEVENGKTLILFDVPVSEQQPNNVSYFTLSMEIILTERCVVTVCLKENAVVSEFAKGIVKNVQTEQQNSFFLHILLRMAVKYQQYLRQMEKISNYIEKQIHVGVKNKDLVQLIDLKKSLVYFTTSLKANEITLEKLLRGRLLRLSEEDRDLLEDVLVEVKQAIEMSNIYVSVLTSTLSGFSTIISNNFNKLLSILISVAVLAAIPIVVFLFYSMNTQDQPVAHFWFPLALSAVAMLAAGMALHKKSES